MLKEFRRKAEAVMGAGLIHSTQREGKLHTRGRDEPNVHRTGMHDPSKQKRIDRENKTGRLSHKGRIVQECGIHVFGTFAYARLFKRDMANDEQERRAGSRQGDNNRI